MEKYLITGFSGFVSKHFIEYLEQNKIESSVLGVDVNIPEFDIANFQYVSCSFTKVDLLNKNDVDNIVFQFQPQYILHLASFSSVAFSWKNPVASFTNNTNIFLNLLETIRSVDLKCRILSIGSSEEYGNVNAAHLPLHEELVIDPISPYAVARVAQEMLSKVYVNGYNMDIVMTRSFNHIGPGQRDIFVISSFARRLSEIKTNNLPPVLETGDLSIIRDFLDVRDVVAAYYKLLKTGVRGEIYNVCSGVGTSLDEIINIMSKVLNISISKKTNEDLVRPNDNKIIIGSFDKLNRQTGWKPKIELNKSLIDVLDFWSKK
ncbi:MAG TPA: GDP-mannose 4,6-dehydratase [Flavobacterium sp.]|jgi:GDP-4-dehydro-6-deoxy-D-mannose reductase